MKILMFINIGDIPMTEEEMQELRELDTGRGTHDPEAPGLGDMLLKKYRIHD